MATQDRLKIAYVGGGSRFVVTLLHGLAGQAEALKALGRSIELVLLDIQPARCAGLARYAQITAAQTGLALTASVTADRREAFAGTDWVIFSAGVSAMGAQTRRRFEAEFNAAPLESGAGVALECAALWPFFRELLEELRRAAPRAVFSTLVNPTDVLAEAAEQAFGVRAIGVCVEVPGLVGFLSYYLRVREEAIRLEHVGANHVGWVSRWTTGGADGAPVFAARMKERMQGEDWYPACDEFVRIFERTGYLRSSPYHYWPYVTPPWGEAKTAQKERWRKACLRGHAERGELRQAALEKALRDGAMIPPFDPTSVHPEATPYSYPNSRHTLAALAVSLAGGAAGPVPLQVRNGASNSWLPADVRVEVPARIEAGRVEPQRVEPPPEWLFAQTRMILEQRAKLAQWLARGEAGLLTEALFLWPGALPVPQLARLAEELKPLE
jgi:6-phospho-beta-glucosidase